MWVQCGVCIVFLNAFLHARLCHRGILSYALLSAMSAISIKTPVMWPGSFSRLFFRSTKPEESFCPSNCRVSHNTVVFRLIFFRSITSVC